MHSPPDEQVRAGQIVRGAIALGRALCRQEIDGAVLDREIEQFIRSEGGVPALKGYKPPFTNRSYEHTICLSLNNEAVHGTPAVRKVSPEDLISIDLVVGYKGWFADSARTFTYSKDPVKTNLVVASQIIFAGALAAVLPNQLTALFGATVEAAARHVKLTPVREYCGHGIGEQIHAAPQILNYAHEQATIFQTGQAYAVEPVLATKTNYRLSYDHPDGWTASADCLCSHNEDTLFISDRGVINLTGDQS